MSNSAQRSFAHGELAPGLHARADLAVYGTGLRTCRNAYILKTGGLRSRPGTTYKGTSKSSGAARLVPCVFDDDQNYVLEFGNFYIRFWKNGSLVQATTIGWVNGDVYAAGIAVLHNAVRYVCIVGHIGVAGGGGNEPGVGASTATYWHPLSTTDYEWPSPYQTSHLAELQFQAGRGVLRIVSHRYDPRGLYRAGDAEWRLATLPVGATLAAPAGITATMAAGLVVAWTVTAVDALTGTESAAGTPDTGDTLPSAGSTNSLSWSAVTGATTYRVYKSLYGSTYQLVAEDTASPWVDDGSAPMDPSITPSILSRSFNTNGTRPSVIGSFQQRTIYSGSTGTPDIVNMSKTGIPENFGQSSPIVDADAVTYRMAGPRAVRPRHFLEVAKRLIQFSNVGEYVIEGDESGIISPGAVNPRLISSNGVAVTPAPLDVNTSALYVQARGSLVRDLVPNAQSGDGGTDLTVTAVHLVEGYTISAWCYQQTPHSVIWAIRSDGVLLSLTYQPESGVLGWAKHDTDGTVESICCVPESTEDAVYLLVNRTISAATVRYVERFGAQTTALASRYLSDAGMLLSGAHPHSTLSLNASGGTFTGGNTTGVVATGSGGSGSFTSADVGRTIALIRSGTTYAATITGYTSATIVTITITGVDATGWTNPTAITTANWWWTSLNGLSHLNGEAVSVTLDGAVYASPNNPGYTTRTVASGILLLANTTAAFTTAVVGLPFTVDVQTLDLDAAATSVRGKPFRVNSIGAWLEESRPFWAGNRAPSTDALDLDILGLVRLTDEAETVVPEGTLFSGFTKNAIPAKWTKGGRIFLRQVDPVPLTILALVPIGDYPERE